MQLNLGELDTSDSDMDDSSGSWFTDSSNESVICADYWAKLKNIPVQLLCMESFDTTLTEIIKQGIDEREWLSILFQICFGLAAGQKHLKFIHNDLHSDNIMFKKIDK